MVDGGVELADKCRTKQVHICNAMQSSNASGNATPVLSEINALIRSVTVQSNYNFNCGGLESNSKCSS